MFQAILTSDPAESDFGGGALTKLVQAISVAALLPRRLRMLASSRSDSDIQAMSWEAVNTNSEEQQSPARSTNRTNGICVRLTSYLLFDLLYGRNLSVLKVSNVSVPAHFQRLRMRKLGVIRHFIDDARAVAVRSLWKAVLHKNDQHKRRRRTASCVSRVRVLASSHLISVVVDDTGHPLLRVHHSVQTYLLDNLFSSAPC